jgi:predicted  nucleic acid-binding Zn-ribbon protein
MKDLRRLHHENGILSKEQSSLEKKLGKLLRENNELKKKITVCRDKIYGSAILQHE